MNENTNNNSSDAPAVVAVERDGDAQPTVRPIAWWESVLVRATRAAIASLLGGGTAMGGAAWLLGFSSVIALKATALSAAGAFVYSALQNTGELLAKLDQTNPKLRG